MESMAGVVPCNTRTQGLERWAVPGLILAFVVFYLLPLMSHGLWIPDETRYAQISQEMLQSGNWVAPHFMGLRYFEKPVAGYWMIAIGQAVFGDNLFGVRIASALSTGLSIWLAWLIAGRLWRDPRKRFASALLYMSFGLVAGQAGYANLDPQFTFWVNLSITALWYAFDSTTRRARLCAWAVLGLACGMGFMTKGFLAWLLPLLIAVPYALWQRRVKEVLSYGPLAILVAVAASLPWAALLPKTLMDAWKQKRQPAIGFLLMWMLLPLAIFSMSKGKLPTYIMPCLLPLALLMGHAVVSWVEQAEGRSLRINGLLNVLLAVAGLVGLAYLQFSRPVYDNTEVFSLSLAYIVLLGWLLSNALQALRPLLLWAAPAVGMGVLVALLPAAMPGVIVNSKMPDQFIAEHVQELSQARTLLSNDLGAASALSWRLGRPEITLYNSTGELKYGLGYADSAGRQVEMDNIDRWMKEARLRGPVGVVMRVHSALETHEVELLPLGGKRYERGDLAIFIFPKVQPE